MRAVRGALRKPRSAGGGWSYRIDLGVGPDGRRRQRQQGGFRTKREAQAALNDALAELQRGEFVSPSKQTFADFTEAWLAAVRGELAESAWANYGALMRTYVLPRVGAVRLVDLTPQRVQALYVELLERGKKDGSPLSARSVLQVHRTLHRALGDAVRWRLLARNPAHGIRPPRTEKKEMTAWSATDARAFLAGTASDRLAALWVVALNSGMRRGELAGLRWADVDLDGATIAVTQQRTTAHYKVVVGEPKARSRRVIPVDAAVVDGLRAHRRRQLEERLLVGPAWMDSGYVFVDELGVPYHPERLRVLFERSCRAVGVPPIRLHDLRHTMATAALQAGIHPKVVQERLGHSSIAITLDTYSHVAPTLQREAADKLGQLFAP
jgi:integrase